MISWRSHRRAQHQALGSLVCLGRRTLWRIIWTNGGSQRSWSVEYFLRSRCEWQPQRLFQPIVESALAWRPGPLVGVAVDDTRLHKSGPSIEQAFYQRDPMSPPFHCNLMLGWRFLQASLLLLPLERQGVGAWALPIRFPRRSGGEEAGPEVCVDASTLCRQEWRRATPFGEKCRLTDWRRVARLGISRPDTLIWLRASQAVPSILVEGLDWGHRIAPGSEPPCLLKSYWPSPPCGTWRFCCR